MLISRFDSLNINSEGVQSEGLIIKMTEILS
jgi:hypothetical protein